ncbi:MAG: hypothetical protein WBA74_05930 [Cyclobacteriaceae bacterium]
MKKLIPVFLLCAIICFSCQTEEEVIPTETLQTEQSKLRAATPVFCISPTITWSPCDRTFQFKITRGGVVDNGTFWYAIRTTGGTVVDFGYITHNSYTNPVLSHCTQYNVELGDTCDGPVVQQKTSDGCNGLFFC